MPYKSMKDVNPAIRGIKPQPTLAQANLIASWADSIKDRRGDVNPWRVAIALFRRQYHREKDKWVKNKDGSSKTGLADEVLDLIEGLEILDVLPVVMYIPDAPGILGPYADDPEALEIWEQLMKLLQEEGYEVETSEPLPTGDPGLASFGEAAYVVDLLADLPQTAEGKPDFSQPFRILPVGTIHRYGERTVTVDDINQFEDNWRNRTQRGIRRQKVVIDVEHEPGGVALYTDIFSRETEGLWARINLTERGQELLAERDFWFFSPTVAWESKDRKTGQVIKNQIVGGALTNFPVFGDDTRLPAAYSEAALHRMLAEGYDMSAYAITKTSGDGKAYPASAWLIVGDPKTVGTWHLRYKEYVSGRLQVTKNMCSKAAQALSSKGFRGKSVKLSAGERAKAKSKLRSLYQNTLKVPKDKVPQHLFSEKGDEPMTETTLIQTLAALVAKYTKKGEPSIMADDNDKDKDKGDKDKSLTPNPAGALEFDAEAFAAIQTQLATLNDTVEKLSAERDEFAEQLKTSQEQLAVEVTARQLTQMREHVQSYSHLALPLELAKDAPKGSRTAPEHFAWLRNVDQSEGQVHWAFFNEVLKVANAALDEAELFTELGAAAGQPLDEDARLHKAAATYAKEHEVDYMTALKVVSAGAPPAAPA